jgi:hypothetical protein
MMTLEIGKEIAVIRTDVDNQVIRPKFEHRRAFPIEFGEIIPQYLCVARDVCVGLRENYVLIDDKAGLNKMAILAI